MLNISTQKAKLIQKIMANTPQQPVKTVPTQQPVKATPRKIGGCGSCRRSKPSGK